MPRIVKKTATRRAHRAKSKGISKAQRDSLKVDLTLVMRMEEWARRHDSSLGDAIERAFSDFLDKDLHEQDDFIKILEAAPEDDEPFTDEERASAEEGWKEYLEGKSRPWVEVRKELAGGAD